MIPADELFGSSDDADLLPGEPKGSIEPAQPQHPGAVALNTIEQALAQLRAGRPIVVVDDEDRENEGDLIFAASLATPELTAFMIRHTSGYICVGMTGADLDRLELPPMAAINEDRRGTAYAVTVEDRKSTRLNSSHT